MHHTCGWSESVDQATLAAIAALSDPVLTISGDNLQVPEMTPQLGIIVANGVNLLRAQLQSPSLRRVVNFEARPVQTDAAMITPNPCFDFMDKPIQLDIGEQLQGWANEDGAGATRMNIFINLVDKAVEKVNVPFYSVRATSAQTLVAYAWTNGVLTFDQVLPVGKYAIIGARCESAGMLAFRFVLQNQTPRPGGFGVTSDEQQGLPNQRGGGWGVWGTFDSFTPPTVDFLSASADTSEIVTLDLVKVE